jgi:hypothetical protein
MHALAGKETASRRKRSLEYRISLKVLMSLDTDIMDPDRVERLVHVTHIVLAPGLPAMNESVTYPTCCTTIP